MDSAKRPLQLLSIQLILRQVVNVVRFELNRGGSVDLIASDGESDDGGQAFFLCGLKSP